MIADLVEATHFDGGQFRNRAMRFTLVSVDERRYGIAAREQLSTVVADVSEVQASVVLQRDTS